MSPILKMYGQQLYRQEVSVRKSFLMEGFFCLNSRDYTLVITHIFISYNVSGPLNSHIQVDLKVLYGPSVWPETCTLLSRASLLAGTRGIPDTKDMHSFIVCIVEFYMSS